MEKEQKKPNYTLLRVIVIVVVLILLVILSIGIVRFVPKALNSLASASLSIGNVFNNGSSTDTTDDTAVTTDTTSIATSSGGFSIRDLTTNSTTTISGNTSGIGGTNNAGVQNTIRPSTGSTRTNTNTGTQSGGVRTNNQSTSYAVGSSDIAVEILSKGIIDRATNAFVPSNSFTTSDAVVIKFKIENRGASATGPWSARVSMPSANAADTLRTLGPVNSLPAQAAVTGEARFDRPLSGNQNVVIAVDTANTTQDTNRSNNTISLPLYVTGTGNNPVITNGSQADLQIQVLSTGSVNSAGQYSANVSPRMNSGEKAAVRFQVTNNGGVTAPTWSWRADISGANTSTYYSPAENPIVSGGSATFIVGLDIINNGYNYGTNYNNYNTNNCYTGYYYSGYQDCLNRTGIYSNGYYNNTNYSYGYGSNQMFFNIYIDTNNNVYESNESNNSASATVNIQY